ncbi:hypothetical protein CPER28S_01136 [Cellulomonas persica]
MTRQNLPRTRPRRALASAVCATLVAAGAGAATVGAAAPAPAATPSAAQHTITPNPAYAGDPFEGWGNSLVWFANATGDYPDELREELFDLVFGEDGLNMNVARYNIGGGRASDVGDYFRQGAAVDGYWAHDSSTDPDSLYGTATTRFADHLALAQAWDPQDEASYDWTKDATQRWWLEKLAAEREDLVLEAFSNSPPWFLTRSGYSSGGASSTTEQVLTQYGAPAAFTAYLTKVVEHLEDTYDVRFQSVDPFNEPCTGYWSTPTGRLADGITPFTTAVKKPQEGAQICPGSGVGQQQSIIALLADDLAASSSDAVVSANDETNPQAFNNAWAQYDAATRADVGQINVHTYSDGGAAQSRDHALASGKGLWMSETGGNWVGAGFDPVNISGALGLAQKITSDLRTLQPDAYVLWQEVEDFYNMELGEKLNWGSIFIDFDCEYVDADGEVVDETDAIGFKSLRRVADAVAAGDPVSSVDDCHIVTNSKYDAMRNFMQFITAGDRLIPTDDAASTAALDADGTGATVVHTNATLSARAVTLDLTRFGSIATGASVTPYVTTQAADVDDTSTALVRGTPVPVGADGRATLTIPARSVVTFVIDGVSGVAPDANPLVDGASYQLVGVQSGKALAMSSAATLQIKDLATTSAALPAQTWVAHETTRYRAPSARRTFTLENVAGGTFLGATSEGTRFEAVTAAQAAESATTTWHLVTLDGTTWSFVNSATASALDVNGQSTADGASVGVYGSNDGGNQRWRVRATSATPSAPSISLRTTVGTPAPLPATVVPTYSWGAGVATPVTWGVPADAWDRAGTVTLTGTGTDIYGNAVVATAVVEVGDLVATDPASVTVVAGSSLDLVRGSAPATVRAQVGTSSARFTVPVTWDFTALTDASFATSGVVTVPGAVDAQAGTGGQAVAATLHVIVGAAAGTTNVALTSTPSASFTESTSYAVTRTINGDRGDKGWSNWKSGTKNETDTLTYTLAQPALLDEARIYFWKDGSSATWPTTVTTQYRDLATNQWTSLPAPVELPEQETAPSATIDLSGVSASAVRFVLTARPATHLIVAETEIDAAVPAAFERLDARAAVRGRHRRRGLRAGHDDVHGRRAGHGAARRRGPDRRVGHGRHAAHGRRRDPYGHRGRRLEHGLHRHPRPGGRPDRRSRAGQPRRGGRAHRGGDRRPGRRDPRVPVVARRRRRPGRHGADLDARARRHRVDRHRDGHRERGRVRRHHERLPRCRRARRACREQRRAVRVVVQRGRGLVPHAHRARHVAGRLRRHRRDGAGPGRRGRRRLGDRGVGRHGPREGRQAVGRHARVQRDVHARVVVGDPRRTVDVGDRDGEGDRQAGRVDHDGPRHPHDTDDHGAAGRDGDRPGVGRVAVGDRHGHRQARHDDREDAHGPAVRGQGERHAADALEARHVHGDGALRGQLDRPRLVREHHGDGQARHVDVAHGPADRDDEGERGHDRHGDRHAVRDRHRQGHGARVPGRHAGRGPQRDTVPLVGEGHAAEARRRDLHGPGDVRGHLDGRRVDEPGRHREGRPLTVGRPTSEGPLAIRRGPFVRPGGAAGGHAGGHARCGARGRADTLRRRRTRPPVATGRGQRSV